MGDVFQVSENQSSQENSWTERGRSKREIQSNTRHIWRSQRDVTIVKYRRLQFCMFHILYIN